MDETLGDFDANVFIGHSRGHGRITTCRERARLYFTGVQQHFRHSVRPIQLPFGDHRLPFSSSGWRNWPCEESFPSDGRSSIYTDTGSRLPSPGALARRPLPRRRRGPSRTKPCWLFPWVTRKKSSQGFIYWTRLDGVTRQRRPPNRFLVAEAVFRR